MYVCICGAHGTAHRSQYVGPNIQPRLVKLQASALIFRGCLASPKSYFLDRAGILCWDRFLYKRKLFLDSLVLILEPETLWNRVSQTGLLGPAASAISGNLSGMIESLVEDGGCLLTDNAGSQTGGGYCHYCYVVNHRFPNLLCLRVIKRACGIVD